MDKTTIAVDNKNELYYKNWKIFETHGLRSHTKECYQETSQNQGLSWIE